MPGEKKNIYYVHEFTTEEHIYGEIIENEERMNIKELLEEYKKRSRGNFVSEFENDDGSCYENEGIELEIEYKSKKEVKNYVRIMKKDLEGLLKAGANIYCDYMDQGFNEITNTEKEKPTKEENDQYIRELLWADNDEELMECYAGETAYVSEKEYEKYLKNERKILEHVN
jgi:hypothetical protein